MPVVSDVSINTVEFRASSIDVSTEKLTQILEKAAKDAPRWYEVGAPKFRKMVYEGKTPFPVPPLLTNAQDATVPSREPGRNIWVRFYTPDNGKRSKGVYLYFHGGGFVMGSHKDQDDMLKTFANSYRLTAVSVGYRLAPENPFPAGINDCVDVAEYLTDHGPAVFSAPLRVIGGSSSGGNFAALTTLQLMRTRPQHRLDAVLFVNGFYDLTLNLPTTVQRRDSVVIDREMLEKFIEVYAPGASVETLRSPFMSPLYEDLQRLARESPFGTLPPALFTCGTADPLLDDSLMMSAKWMASGSEAVIKLYPGAPHMFSAFKGFKVADDVAAVTMAFLNEKLAD
ncbi:alpha/beta-hydrolase [Viridothelium virens]|uniref:Alpha/beta-hydrolase n=1 Tax=Viridothelium virens TaxID=1048519 RepID=A0A6A6H818_VIRVR|nr:alpha/beta-hydrolase [Viridothelium virens]